MEFDAPLSTQSMLNQVISGGLVNIPCQFYQNCWRCSWNIVV